MKTLQQGHFETVFAVLVIDAGMKRRRKKSLWFLCLFFSRDLPLHFAQSGCLEEGLEALLKATGSSLLILKVSHCPNLLTDRSLWLASCYCRALQAVTYR